MSMDIEPGSTLTQEQYNWLLQRDRVDEAVNLYGCELPESVRQSEGQEEMRITGGDLATAQTAGPRPASEPGTLQSVHPEQVGMASRAGGVVLIEDVVDDSDIDEDDEVPPYEEWAVDDLEAEINRRNEDRDPEGDSYITPEGSGKNGNVLKADLVAALEADDEDDNTE